MRYRPTDLVYGDYGMIRDPAYKYSQEREKAFLKEDILSLLTIFCLEDNPEYDKILVDKLEEKKIETLLFTVDVLKKQIKKHQYACPVYQDYLNNMKSSSNC